LETRFFFKIKSCQWPKAKSQKPFLQFSRFLQPNVKENNGQNKKHISFVFYKMFEKGNPKSYRQ
jgi:hypothetical protein